MVKIDLSGPQGNAFFVLGIVDKALCEKGCTKEQREEYYTNATSSDYDNLLNVTRTTLYKFNILYCIDFSDDEDEDEEDNY